MTRTFSLLVLHKDRIIRLSIPRWSVYAFTAALALTSGVGVPVVRAVWLDYVALKRQLTEVAGLKRENEEQRRTLASVRGLVAEVQGEVLTWRDLHAKLWEPFGTGSGAARKGTGGAVVSERSTTVGIEAGVGQEVGMLASEVREEGQRLRAYERFISRAGRVLASIPSRWPLHGNLNSGFGRRRSPWTGQPELHSGVDLGAVARTPVKAPAAGRVTLAGPKSDYGLAVVLDHGNHIESLYGHLDEIRVKPGQRVERGQVVALSGNTGRSTGPHLHYEVWVKGKPVNPRGFLWD